jgi:AraC-like DNA-binding protein
MRMRLTGDEDVAVGTMTVVAGFRGRLHHEHDHLILWAHTGTVVISGPDVHGPLGKGVPTILIAGHEYGIDATPGRLSVIRISDPYLRGALERAGAPDARGADSSSLRVALQSVVPALFEPSTAEHHGFREQVVDAVVAAFRTGAVSVRPTAATGPRGRLERALTFIRDHAREPIGVAEIAEIAGLTNRGVQQLFQREVGATPTEVLRTTRLEGTRTELREAGPDTLIADIARGWQFRHLGRFAGLYRRTFGESPSETLRSRGGRAD